MTKNLKRHLLTLYTRSPLHVGSGTSVDVVDLPIMRERITGFPVIPASSLKGVLLQRARELFDDGKHARSSTIPSEAKILFGAAETEGEGESKKQIFNAGCVQIMEAKILAFPVRSMAGCFAWITSPAVMQRFYRDTGLLGHADGKDITLPQPAKDRVIAGSDLIVNRQVVLEEYALELERDLRPDSEDKQLLGLLSGLVADPIWAGNVQKRIAILHDENFQHFVMTCTEVVARIKVDPASRTVDGGALFNQENVPSEALFYSVISVLPPRRNGVQSELDPSLKLAVLLPEGVNAVASSILQIGGDETTGHGLCEAKRKELK